MAADPFDSGGIALVIIDLFAYFTPEEPQAQDSLLPFTPPQLTAGAVSCGSQTVQGSLEIAFDYYQLAAWTAQFNAEHEKTRKEKKSREIESLI